MSRYKFKKIMKNFLLIKENNEKLNISLGVIELFMLQLIEELFEDKEKWIRYWIYEMNCGKNCEKKIWSEKDELIPMKTLDNLYDQIKKI
jgi:hypothetical protein